MKKTLLPLLALCIGLQAMAQIRVISDQSLGNGFYPRFVDENTVSYVENENSGYLPSFDNQSLYVDNEDLTLNLYRDGEKTVLSPDGSKVNYIWSSLSPDQTMILYNTARGTSVCDLNGKVLYRLGQLNAPVWYGNTHVVGMHDMSDGHVFTASSIAIRELKSGHETELISSDKMAMYPTVDAQSGRIAYNTLNGEIRLMQLNLTDYPIRRTLPKAVPMNAQNLQTPSLVASRTATPGVNNPEDIKIYINPGHGGHWSNDRNMVIYPFQPGDENGFWESNSNLDKGLALDTMLRALGFQTKLSRTTNNNGGGNDKDLLDNKLKYGDITKAQYDDMLANGDDRALSAIVAEANAFHADFMLSIHSNAGGPQNYVILLYAGVEPGDTHVYPTPTPCSAEGRAISTIIANALQSNTLTPWTTPTPQVGGDKTFGRIGMGGWSDGYGVLRGLTVPGTISEGSMHDYIPQTYRLMNMDFKKQEAWYFANSLYSYFCNRKMPTGVIGGQVRDMNNRQMFPDIKRIHNSYDELQPIDSATVLLMQDGEVLKTYRTDCLYNGIFFFWDLVPGTYTIRVQAAHYYQQDRTVVVKAGEMNCETILMNMQRETRPEVLSYSPCPQDITDSVEVSTPIVLNFNWDMLADSTIAAFSITPAVEGKIEFSNSQRTMTFTPNNTFDAGVEYLVRLSTTACHPDTSFENHLANDFVFSFRTKNRAGLQLLQHFPLSDMEDVALKPTFLLVFDAELNSKARSLASQEFELTADNGVSIKPTSRQVTVNTVAQPLGSARFELSTALQPNTTYTMHITEELADLNNVHVASPISFSFTTGSGAGDTRVGEVLNPLDTLFFVVNADKTKGLTKKTLMRSTSNKSEGEGSNKITYNFAADQDEAELYLGCKTTYIFNSTHGFGMDVYGDMSHNAIYLELMTDGDMRTIKLCDLDFVGWKYFHIALKELPESVDFQLMGIKLVRQKDILSGAGEIYFDRMMRSDESQSALDEVWLNNPSDKFINQGALYIRQSDRLFNAEGKQLQ